MDSRCPIQRQVPAFDNNKKNLLFTFIRITFQQNPFYSVCDKCHQQITFSTNQPRDLSFGFSDKIQETDISSSADSKLNDQCPYEHYL